MSSDDGARDEVMCVPDAVREMFDDGEAGLSANS